jgi:branched-chain amino acid transport system ATP-binding protein
VNAGLRAHGLHLHYGSLRTVDGVDLSLEPGARHALIGPNGAGKSTLIDLLAGVRRPDTGRIELDGVDITALPTERRARLGLVRTFQVNTLFHSLSPLRSVVLAIAEREGLGGVWWRPLAPTGRHRALFDEAHALLAALGLDAQAEVPAAELPYGRQRVLEIALALAARPRVLLLDEPAAGVPEAESGELLRAVDALPADVAVLFIEHDMKLVFRFARRITVLAAGRVLAEGTPEEIAADTRVREAYLRG